MKNVVVGESGKHNIEEVAKKLRNFNILAYCNGNERVSEIIETLKTNMTEVGYTKEEVEYAVKQIGLVSLATDLNTQSTGCTVVDFHEFGDSEVSTSRIHKETINAVNSEGWREGFFKVDEKRVEYILAYADEHSIKHYLYDGVATPACLRKVISNLLKSSINAHNGNFEPLTTEQIMQGCKELVCDAKDGKGRAELLQRADETISYEGARKLTEREGKTLAELEKVCDSVVRLQKENRSLGVRLEDSQAKVEGIMKSVKENCSDTTKDKISLDNKMWQYTQEESKRINEAPSDKTLIETQSEKINEQKQQILNLFSKLKTLLDFADNVRNSAFGKIFFGKQIKKLPPADSTQSDGDR